MSEGQACFAASILPEAGVACNDAPTEKQFLKAGPDRFLGGSEDTFPLACIDGRGFVLRNYPKLCAAFLFETLMPFVGPGRFLRISSDNSLFVMESSVRCMSKKVRMDANNLFAVVNGNVFLI